MSNDLYRLVYYSHNAIADDPTTLEHTINAILAESQVNNERVGVTGALMFNAGCFAQVLEGPRTSIEDVFEEIQRDERHSDVVMLGFEPVPARMFANWSMGYVGASVAEAARYGTVAQQSGFDPTSLTGEALLMTLYKLALEDEPRAA